MTINEFKGEYSWLSNFYPAEVTLDGETYASVEHAYQAAKTTNQQERESIRVLSTPSQAKSRGKRVTLRKDWEEIKLSIMEELVSQKFRNPELRARLLETGDRELIEGNWWGDRYWGMCKGVGLNHLGRIIMRVRDRLRSEAEF